MATSSPAPAPGPGSVNGHAFTPYYGRVCMNVRTLLALPAGGPSVGRIGARRGVGVRAVVSLASATLLPAHGSASPRAR